MLVYFALGDAKVWHWGSKPTPVPKANGFASQWNIGFRLPYNVNVVVNEPEHNIPQQVLMHTNQDEIRLTVHSRTWQDTARDK